MLGERRALAQDGQELGLTFGSNNPVAQEVEVTGIVTKRGWEVKLAPCPSMSTSTHTGKGAGRWGDRVVGRGQVGFWSQKGCFVPYCPTDLCCSPQRGHEMAARGRGKSLVQT